MKKFVLIGSPLKHSLSPLLHNYIFQTLNIDAKYEYLELQPSKLKNTLADQSISGLNITIPYKTKVMDYLDEVNQKARDINSVNCIKNINGKSIGFNTDWYGFSMMLKNNNISIFEKSFLVLGSGGAAKSIIYVLLRERAKEVFVTNRTKLNAINCVSQIEYEHSSKLEWVTLEDIKKMEIGNWNLINCTPVGMYPNISDSPFPRNMIGNHNILIDTIYNPIKTKFLDSGKNIIINGLDMFIFQALASLDLWFESDISNQVDFNELKELLGKKIC